MIYKFRLTSKGQIRLDNCNARRNDRLQPLEDSRDACKITVTSFTDLKAVTLSNWDCRWDDETQAADALETGRHQRRTFRAWQIFTCDARPPGCGNRCGNPHVKVQIKGVRGFKGGPFSSNVSHGAARRSGFRSRKWRRRSTPAATRRCGQRKTN